MEIYSHEEGPGEPAVLAPNSVPTGSRFETSTENYAAGFPAIEEPQWLLDLAERMAAERRAATDTIPSTDPSQYRFTR